MKSSPNWSARLAHERACRDALIECGNPKPTRPDPPGGLVLIEARQFNGKIFHGFIQAKGHTAARFEDCRCGR